MTPLLSRYSRADNPWYNISIILSSFRSSDEASAVVVYSIRLIPEIHLNCYSAGTQMNVCFILGIELKKQILTTYNGMNIR